MVEIVFRKVLVGSLGGDGSFALSDLIFRQPLIHASDFYTGVTFVLISFHHLQTNKVHSEGTEFLGCLYKVSFNGQDVPLWQTVLDAEPSAECCAKPPDTNTPDVIDAVNVNGFGYLQIDSGSFSVVNQSHVSLQFRTFSPSGALLTVNKAGMAARYTVVLSNGRVQFEIWPEIGSAVTLTSTGTSYNNGQWHQV